MQKVFVIGFQKTGTQSLASALRILGYEVYNGNIAWKTDPHMTVEKLRSLALEASEGEYTAFVNNPWPLFYEELEKKFPEAKFILTTRETTTWLESARANFSGIKRPEVPLIYGVKKFDGNEDVFVERYERHNREVEEYFAKKPGKLMVIDVIEEPEWTKICSFLGFDEPDLSFPHVNKRGSLKQELRRVVFPAIAQARKACPVLDRILG